MADSRGRRLLLVAMVAVLAVVASSCNSDWTQFGYGAGNTRATSDAGIDATTLPPLGALFTGTTGSAVYSSPAVASGVAYVTSDDGKLYAFNAAGTTSGSSTCSGIPNSCLPLWTATIEPAGALSGALLSSSPAVVNNIVYVGSTDGKLYAFDATGTTGCSGSPKVCTPLWTGATGAGIYSSPTVVNNVVYVGSNDTKLYAFDATGTTGCSGSPKTCTPLWTGTTGGFVMDAPAVAGNVAYVGSTDGKLYAFDATGTTGCSGSPKTCTPLWTGTTGSSITYSSPAVSGGTVFVGNTGGVLSAFDAAGSTGCSGAPKSCTRLFSATTGGSIVSSPAIASSVLYIGSSDHKLYALDAKGVTNCSGAPKTCSPLWTATTGGVVRSSPAVDNSLVWVGSDDHTLSAFDATGTTNCSGAPKSCTSLWSTTTGAEVASSPILAQGALYFASRDAKLYAYKPWVFARPTCAANPHTGLSPCQIQDAYRLPSAVAGKGRTVAIVDANDNPNAEADLAVYRAAYGLPACTTANGCFKKLNQTGVQGSYPTADHGWGQEITLDLDAVSAACPLCNIVLVEGNSSSLADLVVAEATAAAQSPVAISNSYGAGEWSTEHNADGYYNFPGIIVTASTGDNGFAGGVEWPAAVPGVVAVGGTELASNASTRGWAETAWSGAGSGCSAYEPKPAWQTDGALCANRTLADVSALAGAPWFSIYDTYGDPGWEAFGGTSLASPLVAATYALAYPTVPLATTYGSTASLFDVTTGSTGSCSASYLCNATTGFDGPTGLGTPCGTAAFGTGAFATAACPAAGAATPALSGPAEQSGSIPSCGPVPPGYARCLARRPS